MIRYASIASAFICAVLFCSACDVFVTAEEEGGDVGKLGQPCDKGNCTGQFVVCRNDVCVCEFAPCKDFCCPDNHHCDGNECVPECEPDCLGRVCGPDGCGGHCPPDDCGAGQECVEGECQGECQSLCTDGQIRCTLDGLAAFEICGNYNADDCFEWGGRTDCPANETCSNGECSTECQDECSLPPDTWCEDDDVYSCSNVDADECLERTVSIDCAAGQEGTTCLGTSPDVFCGCNDDNDCPVQGFFCDTDGSQVCQPCHDETHCGINCDNCTDSEEGYICVSIGPNWFCGCEGEGPEHCPAGFFCNIANGGRCEPCVDIAHCGLECHNCEDAGLLCVGNEPDLHCGCTTSDECPQGHWCDAENCVLCETEEHCGPNCMSCEGFMPGQLCIDGAFCGCLDDSHCFADLFCSVEHNHCAQPNWQVAPTGQTYCYDADTDLDCPQWEQDPWYGQDAQYGINNQQFVLETHGGQQLVADPPRELQWMITIEPNLTWQQALDHCNGQVFADMNDWRLPTESELLTLPHRDLENHSINTGFFDYEPPYPIYWSSSPNAGSVWVIDFSRGSVEFKGTQESYNARCVRGPIWGRAPQSRFTTGINHFYDNATGLSWQRAYNCCLDWETALEECKGLTNNAGDDWRLPDINEILSLMDYDHPDGINQLPLLNPPVDHCWTSTTVRATQTNAWEVKPSGGWTVDFTNKTAPYTAGYICVRGPD